MNGNNGDTGTQVGNSITANGANQTFTRNINLSTLLEGTYTLNLWVEDNKGGRSAETSKAFKVDKTAPTVNAPATNAISSSEITITANASDTSGLSAAPYLYNKNGTDITSWILTNPYTDTGLTPNTQYTYKYRAQDALGNISPYSQTVSKYTLANIPTGNTISDTTQNSITASWEANSNPSGTQYALAAFDANDTLIRQNAWTTNLTGTIASLSANKEYKIKVKARNANNIETGWHDIGTITTLPVIPPMPQNLSAEPDINKITLTWSEAEGATKYYIYDNGSEIAQTPNLTYDHLGLEQETTHTYTVKAWNTGGYSLATPELSVTTLPAPPEVPSDITTEPLKNQITLSWSPVEGATKYYIDCDGQITDVGTSTSYTHTGLAPGTEHTYKVKAEKSGLEGDWSTQLSKYTLLEEPSNVVASATTDKMTIWWNSVNGASDYDINIGGTTVNTADTSYTCEGLNAGQTYTYSIKAKNSVTESQWSEERTKDTLNTPPTASQVLNGEADITSITLTWNSVTNATGYDLEADGKIKNVEKATTYTHTGLEPNTTHNYRIRARNSGGKSEWSNILTISTQAIPANVPQNLRASETEDTILIQWDTVGGATDYDLQIDDSTQVRTTEAIYIHEGLEPGSRHTYKVRSVNHGATSNWSPMMITYTRTNSYPIPENLTSNPEATRINVSWDQVIGVTGYDIEIDGEIQENITQTTYEHNGLLPETMHTYRVRTINEGQERGDWSDMLITNTLEGIPQPPKNITTVAYTDKIILSWEPYEEADSYNIRIRSESAINVTDTTYIDSDLPEETEYTYSIQTIIGEEESTWSSPITISTLSNKPPIPANLTGATSSNTIKLMWTMVNGATGYDVRINEGEPISISESEYNHTDLPSQTEYTYEVRATYIDVPGQWSDPVTITTLPQAPSMPTNITTTSGSDAITVTWDDIQGATQYEVEIDYQTKYQGTENTFTLPGLTPGTQHIISVRAKNAGGASSWTPLRTVLTRIGMPGVPENLSASSTLGAITLTWEEVTGALNYDIQIDETTTINVGNQLTYTDTGLASGIQHTYKIRAQNTEGPGEWSPALNKATALNTPEITAKENITDIQITWTPIENATYYDIEIDGVAIGRTAAAINTEVRTTTAIYTHTDLEPDKEHTYKVKAGNEASVSEWSTIITAKTKSPSQTLNCIQDETFDLAIGANNIEQITSKTFTVVFDPAQLQVIDLCSMTPEQDIDIGKIQGTDITITKYNIDEGIISFTIDLPETTAKAIDGAINTIKFKSKINGDTTVKYSAQ